MKRLKINININSITIDIKYDELSDQYTLVIVKKKYFKEKYNIQNITNDAL